MQSVNKSKPLGHGKAIQKKTKYYYINIIIIYINIIIGLMLMGEVTDKPFNLLVMHNNTAKYYLKKKKKTSKKNLCFSRVVPMQLNDNTSHSNPATQTDINQINCKMEKPQGVKTAGYKNITNVT